jgi:hypothetical protein
MNDITAYLSDLILKSGSPKTWMTSSDDFGFLLTVNPANKCIEIFLLSSIITKMTFKFTFPFQSIQTKFCDNESSLLFPIVLIVLLDLTRQKN